MPVAIPVQSSSPGKKVTLAVTSSQDVISGTVPSAAPTSSARPSAKRIRPAENILRDFDGLALGWEESESLIQCFQKGERESAMTIIRNAFLLHPPLPPPVEMLQLTPSELSLSETASTYTDPSKEDNVTRDVILTRYLVDAACHLVMELGLTSWQVATYINIFVDCHRDFIAKISQKRPVESEYCLDLFKSTMLDYNYYRFSRQPFTKQEAINLIDYFCQNYAQHVRLISHVFTRTRDVDVTHMKLHLEHPAHVTLPSTPAVPADNPPTTGSSYNTHGKFALHPLNDGIPAEKWDEWCRAEEERVRLEKEAEERAREEQSRMQAEAEAKAAASLAEAAENQERAKLFTFHPLPLSGPPTINPKTLFPESSNKPTSQPNSPQMPTKGAVSSTSSLLPPSQQRPSVTFTGLAPSSTTLTPKAKYSTATSSTPVLTAATPSVPVRRPTSQFQRLMFEEGLRNAHTASLPAISSDSSTTQHDLTPSTIASTLSQVLDTHLATMVANLSRSIDHQMQEMQTMLEHKEKERKVGREELELPKENEKAKVEKEEKKPKSGEKRDGSAKKAAVKK
ncbi:hypothetical protein DFS34DRAFT_613129 [Phlyctochytrium arcticum]|nr:hypothetical protein DFS34DRAFT_613129 [Phlyctochytrium arcticum]